jgi:hypothetical protein
MRISRLPYFRSRPASYQLSNPKQACGATGTGASLSIHIQTFPNDHGCPPAPPCMSRFEHRRQLSLRSCAQIVVLDKLDYCSSLRNFDNVKDHPNFKVRAPPDCTLNAARQAGKSLPRLEFRVHRGSIRVDIGVFIARRTAASTTTLRCALTTRRENRLRVCVLHLWLTL